MPFQGNSNDQLHGACLELLNGVQQGVIMKMNVIMIGNQSES